MPYKIVINKRIRPVLRKIDKKEQLNGKMTIIHEIKPDINPKNEVKIKDYCEIAEKLIPVIKQLYGGKTLEEAKKDIKNIKELLQMLGILR